MVTLPWVNTCRSCRKTNFTIPIVTEQMRFVQKTNTDTRTRTHTQQVLTSVDELEQERTPENTAEPQLLLGTFHSRVHLFLFPREKTLLFNSSSYILLSFLLPWQVTVDSRSSDRASAASERHPKMNRETPGASDKLRPQLRAGA